MTSKFSGDCCPNCGARINYNDNRYGSKESDHRFGHSRHENRPRFRNGRIRTPSGRASKWWEIRRFGRNGYKKLPVCVHPAHVAARERSAVAAERRRNLRESNA